MENGQGVRSHLPVLFSGRIGALKVGGLVVRKPIFSRDIGYEIPCAVSCKPPKFNSWIDVWYSWIDVCV